MIFMKDNIFDLKEKVLLLNKELNKKDIRINEQDKEIERLNNIIDGLENWCLSWKENDKYCYLSGNDKDKCRYDIWEEVLEKLRELKEGK